MSDAPVATTRKRISRKTAISLVVIGLTFVSVTVGWWFLVPDSQFLLEAGLKAATRNPRASEQLLRRAIEGQGGHHPDAEIALCCALVRRGAISEAKALFTNIDIRQCRSRLLLEFGREARETSLRDQAVAALEQVGERAGPDSSDAFEILVADYQDWGEREKLITAARKLTQLQPDNPKHWASLIEFLTSFARESESLEAIQTALRQELPIELRRTIQNLFVQQLVNQGDAPAARRELSVLQKLDGNSVRVQGLDVYICRLEGKLEHALDLVTAIATEHPDLVFAHFTRGVICLDLGQFDEAVTELELTISKQPFDSAGRYKLAEAYRALGREQEAAENRRVAAEIVGKQKRISTLLKQREQGIHTQKLYQELEALHRELGDLNAAKVWARWVQRMEFHG